MSRNELGGSYRTTTALAMAAYDRLPSEARHALANAVGDYVSQPLLTWYRRGDLDAVGIIRRVDLWDRLELTKREDQRRRAIGPYKGNVPTADRPRAVRKMRR
jgi:hypothetical protein